MDFQILNWLKSNIGNTFPSPRDKVFPSRKKRRPIKLVKVDEVSEIVRIKFVGGNPALPIHFWMFDRTMDYLKKNLNIPVRLGPRIKPPYDDDTVEGQIWKNPYPHPPISPYKSSPHVCDILFFSGAS